MLALAAQDHEATAQIWQSETVMHLTEYRRPRADWVPVAVCPEQLSPLINYLQASFASDETGQIVEIPASGYTNRDTFYEAKGSYSCFRTCNNWANQALKAAKVKTALWSPFDKGVLYHLGED